MQYNILNENLTIGMAWMKLAISRSGEAVLIGGTALFGTWAVSGECGGLPSNGVDCCDWVVHCIRVADFLPGHGRSPHICARPCAVRRRGVQPLHRLGGSPVGHHHYCSLLLAGELPGDWSITELYTCCCWWGLCAHCLILAHQRPQMVQRASSQPPQRHWSLGRF